jgi:protein tyrosine phosphatase (PTP) superfamily phosphohydrolase (DUF442 family)
VKTRTKILLLVALVAVSALGYSQYWVFTGRFGTVVAGRLYRSAELPAEALIATCRRHGITTVIDFRNDPAKTSAEASALKRAGIAHVNLPSGQEPSPEMIQRFLQLMDDRRAEPVLIHCEVGVGRTGVFSAIYRIEYQGWSPFRATLEAMAYSGFASFFPHSPKAKLIANYKPRGSAARQ